MKEDLLHFVWQSKLLLGKTLTTVNNEPISIVHLGTHNLHAGPDFFNAKVRIGDTLWAGNVEMHIRTSEWDNHNHQQDAAYNNVILHVVYVHDKNIKAANGEPVPTLELRNFIPASVLHRYASLQESKKNRIPCENILVQPSSLVLNGWLQRLLVERIEQKCDHIKQLLVQSHHHYEHAFYTLTARYFGMNINEQPFELLTRQLPLSLIGKHKSSLDDIMALVLGVSGLLPGMKELKPHLSARYEHLQQKYHLLPLNQKIWKFGRTRPGNFPTVRLMQFAALLYRSSHLLSKILECETIEQLSHLYDAPIEYNGQKIQLGKDAVNLLLINSVLPFVFVYGTVQHREDLCNKTLNWYEQLPRENNAIIRLFNSLGLKSKNAADTQAFIQLKNEYCNTLNCLKCSIGYQSLLHA
jgi:hypothetical protein